MNIEDLTHQLNRLVEFMLNSEIESESDPTAADYNEPELYKVLVKTEGEPTHEVKLLVSPVRWMGLDAVGEAVDQRTLKVSFSLVEVPGAPTPESPQQAQPALVGKR